MNYENNNQAVHGTVFALMISRQLMLGHLSADIITLETASKLFEDATSTLRQ